MESINKSKKKGMQTHSQIYYHPNPNRELGERHRNNRVKERCLVYTPPGYNDEKVGSYPVLYLLHGVGDVEFSWELNGMASSILDELLREILIPKIIVIMPFGFETNEQKYERIFTPKASFDRYLLGLIRTLETEYKIDVETTGDNQYKRAIAGLSMGGKQALEFGLEHVDQFSAVGNFSGALQMRSNADPLPDLLASCRSKQAQIRKWSLFYHGCGKEDEVHLLIDANRIFVNELKTLGIPHVWHEMEGKHQWGLWRACLREFLPLLASAWR